MLTKILEQNFKSTTNITAKLNCKHKENSKIIDENNVLSTELTEIWQGICWINQILNKARDKIIDYGILMEKIGNYLNNVRILNDCNSKFGEDGKTIKVKVQDCNSNCLEPYVLLEINEKTSVHEVIQLVVKNVMNVSSIVLLKSSMVKFVSNDYISGLSFFLI